MDMLSRMILVLKDSQLSQCCLSDEINWVVGDPLTDLGQDADEQQSRTH